MERLNQTALRLLEIPSVTGQEKEIADQVEVWMRDLPSYKVTRFFDSVVVEAPEPRGKPLIALVGHLDTVPPQGAFPIPRIEGGRLYGLGASDMLSGVAIMVEVARFLHTQDPQTLSYRPCFVFYHSEEQDFAINGLRFLLQENLVPRADLAIVMEPTDGAIQLGCVGVLNIEATMHGKAAHAARPWQGENAITKAGSLLERFHHAGYVKREIQGLTYFDTMQVTLASAGTSRNVVPAAFQFHVNVRFAPDQTVDDALARFQAFVGDSVTWKVVDQAYAGRICAENPHLQRLQEMTGARREPKQAWTDVAQLGAAGIDAINYGPGLTAQAHQREEYADLALMTATFQHLKAFFTSPSPSPSPSP